MTKTLLKYQQLPPTDATPAYEVNLTTAVSLQSSTAVASRHIERQSSNPALTEINLNLNSTQVSSSTSSTGPVSTNQCVSVDNILPPVNELPSYNEAIRLKKLEAYTNELPPGYFDPADTELRHGPETVNLRFFTENANADLQDLSQDIGNNCIFLSAFMIAFFFNWVGFFASICLLPNAAGKYGALSGFGLSMAKWVTIVRYQEWVANMNDFQQKLFFWLFTFLGFYLFFRGLINYMTLRYCPQSVNGEQSATSSTARRNRWFAIIE